MEEKIKDIVSVFIKVPSDQIGLSTAIGRSAVKNSILLHRMYAKLQEEGFVVDNYGEIRTFSDLLQRNIENSGTRPVPGGEDLSRSLQSLSAPSSYPLQETAGVHIGIDIEEIAAMPVTHDFRKEEFYKMNFTPSEIAYCILQADAYASFAGLFTAKEAIIKTGFKARPFNTMDIGHTPEGKPSFPGFQLSISHTGQLAVAVAVALDAVADHRATPPSLSVHAGGGGSVNRLVSWLALLLGVLAIILIFTR